jgi:hypothetical protein
MTRSLRLVVLIAGLGLLVLLSGCPGMPGGGGGGSAQQTPPGVLPPPGLESGGVRSIVGATITPPTNNVLLVTYTTTGTPPPGEQSARRVTITENAVLIEGLNYNGRVEGEPKDVNRLVPLDQVTSFTWRYEGQATPAATPQGGGQAKPSGRGGR